MNAPMPPVLSSGLNPKSIAGAIAFCQAHDSDHHVPLLQAAGAGRIAFTPVTNRLSRPNINALGKARRPALILICDDAHDTTGPLGWAATAQVAQWARGAMVHGTGGNRQSYMLAVLMAEQCGRFVLVETSSDAADAWVDLFKGSGVPSIKLQPASDAVHPIDPEEGLAA